MIIMSYACTITVSVSIMDDSRSINYKNIIIIRIMPQLGVSHIEDSRNVICQGILKREVSLYN